ncbi:hypothetical protein [Peribacillus simplex]|uniref:hypothetical protein n=1 Tax=Peribacillus simplex TaxID=1478 RepID=UPI0012D861C3|nr:hypothetical protein [Peribacillus simplex]
MKWPIRKHSSIRTYSLAGAIVTAIALFLEDIASMVGKATVGPEVGLSKKLMDEI